MNDRWETRRLGDLLTVQNGYAFPSKQFSADGAMPLIRIRDLNPGTGTETRYTGEYEDKYVVRAGDLLIGMDGDFNCYIWNGPDALLNQRVCRLEHFATGLNSKFLFYGINKYLQDINDITGYTTVKHLSSNAINEIEFPLPPLAEQKRIVAILDEVFAAIDAATANTQKNLTNARELFESLLSRAFTKNANGWHEERLGEISDRVSVGHVGPTSTHYCEASDGVPLLRSQNVRRARLDMNGIRHITKAFHARLKKSTLRGGELLFVRVGANRGDCCALHDDIGPLNCANIVFARPKGQSLRFLEYYCNSQQGRERLLGMTTGSAQGVINTRSVAELAIPLPTLEEQASLVDLLDETRERAAQLTSLYTRKLALLAELKQSILHKAFTGELTAKASAADVEAVA